MLIYPAEIFYSGGERWLDTSWVAAMQSGSVVWAIIIVVVILLVLLLAIWLHRQERTKLAAQSVSPEKSDDLKLVEGIGPKIASTLQAAGIQTFTQLAQTEVETLRRILEDADLRLADPTTWPEQARLAAKGDWEALKKLQDSLKGGRET